MNNSLSVELQTVFSSAEIFPVCLVLTHDFESLENLKIKVEWILLAALSFTSVGTQTISYVYSNSLSSKMAVLVPEHHWSHCEDLMWYCYEIINEVVYALVQSGA